MHTIRFTGLHADIFREIAAGDKNFNIKFPGTAVRINREHAKQAREIAANFAIFMPRLSMAEGYAAPGHGPSSTFFLTLQIFLSSLGALPLREDKTHLQKKIPSANDIYVEDISQRPEYVFSQAEPKIIKDPENIEAIKNYIVGKRVVFACCGIGTKEAAMVAQSLPFGGPESIVLNDWVRANVAQASKALKAAGYKGEIICNYDNILSPAFQKATFWRIKSPKTLVMLGGTEGNFENIQQTSWLTFVGKFLKQPGNKYLVGTNNTSHRPTMEASYMDVAYKYFTAMTLFHSLNVFNLVRFVDFKAITCINTVTQANGSIVARADIINTKQQSLGPHLTMEPGRLACIFVRAMSKDTFYALHERSKIYPDPDAQMEFKPPTDNQYLQHVVVAIRGFTGVPNPKMGVTLG